MPNMIIAGSPGVFLTNITFCYLEVLRITLNEEIVYIVVISFKEQYPMIKKSKIIFSVTLFFSMFLYAGDLESIQLEIQQTMESWINNDIDSENMLNSLSRMEANLEEENDNWEVEYWKSRISLVKGQIYFEQREKKLSIRELQKSLTYAEESNIQKEMSDTWRTMSEANSLLMMQKGFLYIVANHALAQDQAKRALELDPDNARASLVIAQFLCNAPSIAGGNLEEGLSLLKTLYKRDDLNGVDRFAILQSLSMIYLDNERLGDAMIYCRLALSLYPQNIKCNELLLEIKEDLKG